MASSDDFYAVHGIDTHAGDAAAFAQREAANASAAAFYETQARIEAEEETRAALEEVDNLNAKLDGESLSRKEDIREVIENIKTVLSVVVDIEKQVAKNTKDIQVGGARIGKLEGKMHSVQNLLVNVTNTVESGQEVQDTIISLFSALKEAVLALAEKSSSKQDIPEVKEFVSLVEKIRGGTKASSKKSEIFLDLPEDTVAFWEAVEKSRISFVVLKKALVKFFERDEVKGIFYPKPGVDLNSFSRETVDILYAMASREHANISEGDFVKFISIDSEAKKIVEELRIWDCPATKHFECSPLVIKMVDCFIEKNGTLDSQENSLKIQSFCN